MHSHHATTLEIRLSWTMFCTPWVAAEPASAAGSPTTPTAASSLSPDSQRSDLPLALPAHPQQRPHACSSDPSSPSAASLSVPSISSLMSQGAVNRELSRRQGLYATSNTASLAIAAGVSGFLFTINSALPFTLIAVLSLDARRHDALVVARRQRQHQPSAYATTNEGRRRSAALFECSIVSSSRSGPNVRSRRRGSGSGSCRRRGPDTQFCTFVRAAQAVTNVSRNR